MTTASLGEVSLAARRGDLVTVSSETAVPQGTRVSFLIRVDATHEPLAFQGKVVSVGRIEGKEDRFQLGVRLQNVTRAQRAALRDPRDR